MLHNRNRCVFRCLATIFDLVTNLRSGNLIGDTSARFSSPAPFGRKRFLRLPMGISLAPECFQRKMEEMQEGLPGVIVYMDDTVVFGDATSHDERLKAVIKRIHESGLKLNQKKCEFRKDEVKFLGMKISKSGISVDEEKLEAIQHLQQPCNVKELRSLLGVINFLCRFVPHIQERLKPLNDLEERSMDVDAAAAAGAG